MDGTEDTILRMDRASVFPWDKTHLSKKSHIFFFNVILRPFFFLI